MFIVTNRSVDIRLRGLEKIGSAPNERGPNELRFAEATRTGGRWKLRILPDEATEAMIEELGIPMSKDQIVFSSRYVAYKLLGRINPDRGRGRNFVVFIPGQSSDLKGLLDRAEAIIKNYGVEVLVFSWPSYAGGVEGIDASRSRMRDTHPSIGALDRTLSMIDNYLAMMNYDFIADVMTKARRRLGDSERMQEFIIEQMKRACPYSSSLVIHGMGNYLYKHLLLLSEWGPNSPIFDNVILVAADVPNADSARWIDRIQCRNRVYITLNENDSVLAGTGVESGDERLSRLGQSRGGDTRDAIYVDFTNAKYVRKSHAYFTGEPVARNARVRQFFQAALTGKRAEDTLQYDPARKLHVIK